MIRPHPESDLTTNTLVLGSDLIRILKDREFMLIESVVNSFLKADKRRTPEMFLNALTFLYTIGIIEKRGYKIKLITNAEVI